MAGEPALDKVLTALRGALVAAPALAGVTVEIDRPDDDALGRGELPHVNIHHGSTEFFLADHSTQGHRATIDLDLSVETRAAATIGKRLRELEADVVAALWADRTLAGTAQDVALLSAGGDNDIFSDLGARPLAIQIIFLTPIGDHRTILGAAGLIP